jgi:hypothetical protein
MPHVPSMMAGVGAAAPRSGTSSRGRATEDPGGRRQAAVRGQDIGLRVFPSSAIARSEASLGVSRPSDFPELRRCTSWTSIPAARHRSPSTRATGPRRFRSARAEGSYVYCVRIEAGGAIGPHEAGFGPLFLVAVGSGWVSRGHGVRWARSGWGKARSSGGGGACGGERDRDYADHGADGGRGGGGGARVGARDSVWGVGRWEGG